MPEMATLVVERRLFQVKLRNALLPSMARSPPIAPQSEIVRLVRVNPVKGRLNRFGQGFRLEWLPEERVIAQVVPKARQIRITAGEEHLEVGSVAVCQAQRI